MTSSCCGIQLPAVRFCLPFLSSRSCTCPSSGWSRRRPQRQRKTPQCPAGGVIGDPRTLNSPEGRPRAGSEVSWTNHQGMWPQLLPEAAPPRPTNSVPQVRGVFSHPRGVDFAELHPCPAVWVQVRQARAVKATSPKFPHPSCCQPKIASSRMTFWWRSGWLQSLWFCFATTLAVFLPPTLT
jgi:hypothetical protein